MKACAVSSVRVNRTLDGRVCASTAAVGVNYEALQRLEGVSSIAANEIASVWVSLVRLLTDGSWSTTAGWNERCRRLVLWEGGWMMVEQPIEDLGQFRSPGHCH